MKPVLEMRVALTAAEYDRLYSFYRHGLGLDPAQWRKNGHGQAALFEMGRASLEILDEEQATLVDDVETGERLSGQVRIAFQVPDLDAAVRRLQGHGVSLIGEPVLTPWKHRNARLMSPDGLQITLFELPKVSG